MFEVDRAGAAVITLDSSTTYQTINGWEPVAELGDREFASQFLQWRDGVVDLAVNDLGLNRVRLELRSGAENPVDSFSQFLAGTITFEDWKAVFYEIINDNADPNTVDPAGFQFSELLYVVDNVVLPLKNAVEANGEQLYINLCVVDFGGLDPPPQIDYQEEPLEYGELVLAAFQLLQSTYGWVPDGLEVALEPDNSAWSGANVGDALVAARDRLAPAGFFPDFIAPSTAGVDAAITSLDEMVMMTDAELYLTELSYHRYAGVSDANLQTIAARGQQYGLDTAMLEHIGSGVADLVKDLKLANVSAWQQFALAFPEADTGGHYILIDLADPTNPELAVRSKYLRQYFRYVRKGAVRIAAATNDSSFDPVAFIHPDGRWVVVVKATVAGLLQVSGLPAGTYGINYTVGGSEATAPTHDGVEATAVTIGAGESLQFQVPDSGQPSTFGAVSIYAIPPVTHTLTVSTAGTGTGTVTSAPAGIDCGVDCSEPYPEDTPVTLTPSPAPGSSFTMWNGDLDCQDGQVVMSQNRSCEAEFLEVCDPQPIVLEEQIDTMNQFVSCAYISVRNGFVVLPTGVVTLTAGLDVRLQNGATVLGELTVAVDPGLVLE